ncbi:MAG TPA: cytochrome c3 family protein [Verrucomicrobiae bacterium]|nr:cytochrome c3 family protein [Verrucomicrobiae bacterium]
MKHWCSIAAAGTLAGLGFVVLALSSCSTIDTTVVSPPPIEGAHFVGNRTCAECHTNHARIFPASPHARYYRDDLKSAPMTGCESCHGPGSEHVRVGGGRGRHIVNPGKDPEVCFQCHVETHAEFHLPQHHPVPEKRMNCVQCHDPHGREILKPARGLAMARLNETCAECHREQARPFVFEHEALREGCTTCHTPHGSINAKLLVERDVNLCLKCHVQTQAVGGLIVIGKEDHTAYLQVGTCFSAGCHTAVHGSNVSPKLRY